MKPRILLCILALCGASVEARGQSGSKTWRGWSFSFRVTGDAAGLELRDVRYEGGRILYKASMPVIRVKYAGDECGPYQDRISQSNIVDARCSGTGDVGNLCSYSFDWGGTRWLELGVYSRIGKYHLYQAWYFSEHGQLHARIWSKGLHCVVDHEHHAYWRLDFDVDGAGNDQAFEYGSGEPNRGWGPGWRKLERELDTTHLHSVRDHWFVRDASSANGGWILPGSNHGHTTPFCTKDAAVRRHHGSEDVGWAFGSNGHLGYDDGESVEEKDNVFWYVGHIEHHADEGDDQWHWTGPTFIYHVDD